MAHSFIHFDGRYLHLRDTDILITIEFLMQVVRARGPDAQVSPHVEELFHWWNNMKHWASGAGCMDLKLDE
jgi:hypothetical protein